ncbi:MAG TPA: PEP-CTERM system histidine kinase PrsK, partial [Chromatiales bacterium]|nr:PEP-CTERM system histidine kinase PrsK [Chromatiales bacterium]HEX21835.1 PEP-CTERM system histidine kinase PrsK [Chromatiales bacterium]
LLVMAAGGYYIKLYGGDWGGAIQLIFFFGAGLLLLVLMFSGQMRARLRIFLSKHFFNYRYDYREEWLRLINTLSGADLDASLRPRVISAIAQIVESPAGMLWWRQDDQICRPVAGWNMGEEVDFQPEQNRSLEAFLAAQVWVIDLNEIDREPESYAGLELPAWLEQLPHAWLIVPLHSASELSGFVVLSSPRARMPINWEVRDLLITTGRQAASYLALLQANEALVDARQFEAFNRLSAYVVHDLKNLVAQLSLVVSNAAKHRDNPAFMEDAISTVENAVNKMNRLLAQLRKGRLEHSQKKYVELGRMLSDVAKVHANSRPAPQLHIKDAGINVIADADRLAAVIGHMVQNAQDATADDGIIDIELRREENSAVIEIRDTGSGMDTQFIRERLFRPFETTKGNAGMGIGVYESREFIHSQGGSLDVRSEPGKGSSFFVRLKIEEADPAQRDVSMQTTTVVD